MSRRLGGLLTNSAPSPNMETMAADFAASKFAPNGYSSRQAAAAAAQENVAQDRQGGPGPPAGPRLGRALSSPSLPQGPTSDDYLALAHAIHQGALAFSVSSMASTATACLWGRTDDVAACVMWRPGKLQRSAQQHRSGRSPPQTGPASGSDAHLAGMLLPAEASSFLSNTCAPSALQALSGSRPEATAPLLLQETPQ